METNTFFPFSGASIRLFRFLLFSAVVFCWFCAEAHANSSEKTKQMVLFLNSYAPGYLWTEEIKAGVLDYLSFEDSSYDLVVEYLDTKKYSPVEIFPLFAELFAKKYAIRQPNVILSADNDAMDFLRRYRDSLFPDVPIVFCGVNNFKESMVDGLQKVTGVVEAPSYAKTIEIALQLFPDITDIYSIAGSDESSAVPIMELNSVVPQFLDRLQFHLLHDLSFAQFKTQIAAIPGKSIVLNLGLYKDNTGKTVSLNEGVTLIRENTQLPIFTMWSHTFLNSFGGVIVSGREQGRQASQMVLQILGGVDPHDIPILKESPNVPTFNYDELARFHIDLATLPEESEIKNLPPPSFLQQYAVQIGVVVFVFLVLLFLVLALFLVVLLRRRTLLDLRNARNYISNIIDSMPSVLISVDKNFRVMQWNRAAVRLTGMVVTQVLGHALHTVFPQIDKILPILQDAMTSKKTRYDFEQPLELHGKIIYVDITVFQLLQDGTEGAVIRLDNVTERVRMIELKEERENLQDQLLQAQRIESIGRLAGGVAHDLNNLLVPILGYAEMLGIDDSLTTGTKNAVGEIYKAGTRARDLIRQLLAFSRKQTLEFKKINLNMVIEDFYKLLRRTIPEHIKIRVELTDCPLTILADRGQIEQVLMNMAVNAADVMPEGGEILIGTALLEKVPHPDEVVASGEVSWCQLTVQDSGTGMDEQVKAKIFEPFFSTKGQLGTGLGLATAYGIIKQHRGNIEVRSELNQGTSFFVSFPLVTVADGVEELIEEQSLSVACGGETLLIVEDNEQVLDMTEMILSRCGYKIFIAKNGKDALSLLQDLHGPVDLLISDIVMPEMNGKELYALARHIYPALKILYMSGYNDNIISYTDEVGQDTPFLQKPFTAVALMQKVRSVLGKLS